MHFGKQYDLYSTIAREYIPWGASENSALTAAFLKVSLWMLLGIMKQIIGIEVEWTLMNSYKTPFLSPN